MNKSNNHETFWFPAKRYGWGWGPPVRWQGWVVLVVYSLLLTASGLIFLPADDVLAFIGCTTILTVVLVFICWLKGEPPKWRWGG